MGANAPTPDQLTADLRALERELWTQEYLMKISEFDGATVAPEKGADARGEALGYLAAKNHALLTGERARGLVRDAQAAIEQDSITDPQLADEVRVLARDQREATAIPEEDEVAFTRLVCEADAVWHKAKNASDWESFEPYVDRLVAAIKHRAACIDPARDPYDVMLDQYERGLTAKQFDAFCEQVRATVVPLVAEIGARPQPAAAFLTARVPEAVQRAMSYDLMRLVGLDMAASTLAFTEHPFSEGFAAGDARVTTHIFEDNLMSNVYSVIHEAGHAIYEQNVDPSYAYTRLEGGTSLGIHESQSRLFENTIGRSRAFMAPLLKVLRQHVPDVYGKVTEDELYRAVNIAQPSLIRTEADELTYPLHIMIRYEIERELFSGEATASDVPRRWADLTRHYLGLEVPDHARGALQDTHWSGGSFGYFPTYALGSAYDAQFLPALERDGVDVDAAAASGDLEPVRAWLRENIWRHGRAEDAPELIQAICGAPLDASFYCDYLAGKFGELYGL
ncbi:MAG: carboxypeptidase M32 [Collinsella sp.]|nr:carboxypeptidase M32 [Collinsella sp.]